MFFLYRQGVIIIRLNTALLKSLLQHPQHQIPEKCLPVQKPFSTLASYEIPVQSVPMQESSYTVENITSQVTVLSACTYHVLWLAQTSIKLHDRNNTNPSTTKFLSEWTCLVRLTLAKHFTWWNLADNFNCIDEWFYKVLFESAHMQA